MNFEFAGSPARILFGAGVSQRVGEVVESLGCRRVLVLSTDFQKDDAEKIATLLGDLCLGVYANAVMHTPVSVTNAAMQVIEEQKVDSVLSFGGGSTVGLGKAIAYRTDLPQIVIPTTYAGSEVTPILGQTENGVKTTLKSPKVLPEVVLYDPDYTYSLPVAMSVTSGLNAIAHAVEALYAQNRNPVSTLMAAEGAKALIGALPEIVKDGQNKDARQKAQYGAWLCGTVLGQVGMAIHHKLCHTLGGTFDLPHAETHSVILPYATAYNEEAAGPLLDPLRDALGGSCAGRSLFDLNRSLGAPKSLADLGMPESGIDTAAEIAMSNPYWNPANLEHGKIRELIAQAHRGDPPGEFR